MVDDQHNFGDLVDFLELFIAHLLLEVPVTIPVLICSLDFLLLEPDVIVEGHDALSQVVLIFLVLKFHSSQRALPFLKVVSQFLELILEDLVSCVDRAYVFVLGRVFSPDAFQELLVRLDCLPPFLNPFHLLSQDLDLPFLARNLIPVGLVLSLVLLNALFQVASLLAVVGQVG